MLSTKMRQVLLATICISGVVFLNAALVSDVGAQQGGNKPAKQFIHFTKAVPTGTVFEVYTVPQSCELSITDIHINAVDERDPASTVSGTVSVAKVGPLPSLSNTFSATYHFNSQSTVIDNRSTGVALLPGDKLGVFTGARSAQLNFGLSGVLACRDT